MADANLHLWSYYAMKKTLMIFSFLLSFGVAGSAFGYCAYDDLQCQAEESFRKTQRMAEESMREYQRKWVEPYRRENMDLTSPITQRERMSHEDKCRLWNGYGAARQRCLNN